ncbi:MAG: HD domain-containing protein [Pseudomonadota bacterium]|nr:HD domain-containing protein [Pseudomonadota bacterium]
MLFAHHGAAQYSGEPVTQLEHALQTAHLAEQSEASDELVTACLLHDLGHLLYVHAPTVAPLPAPGAGAAGVGAARRPAVEQGETPTLRGIDDTHQYFALPFLRSLFADAVLDAIRLHVDAKRYLCQVDGGYYQRLSADSKRSLALQGGVFDPAGAAAFLAQRGARDAVLLRQWDDRAKQADLATPSLAHFLDRAAACANSARR